MRSYKIEIKPTQEQISKINQTIGVCRYLYNLYLATNQEKYDQGLPFISGMDFDKWINNVHSKVAGFEWIKDVSSKARKKSIMNGEAAYKKFFKKLSRFPKFKKKRNQDVTIYFPKNNDTAWTVERHRIKIPTLGWMRLKEFGYLPSNAQIKSGTVSFKAGRYYVSVLVDKQSISTNEVTYSQGVGIDLGVKDLAIVSNGQVFKNINKTGKVKKLKKLLKHAQRQLSRKYEMRKRNGGTAANINKQCLRVQKLYQRITNIRYDHINKVIAEQVKNKPSYITIEDLNIRGMMKNRHLSRAIGEQCLSMLVDKLITKAKYYGIELRQADRFFPSSKTCSCCGNIKSDLKLKDRTYNCTSCGLSIDRDVNAAINLRDVKKYKIA